MCNMKKPKQIRPTCMINSIFIYCLRNRYINCNKEAQLSLNGEHRKPSFSEISWSVSALLSGSCKSWPGH